LDQRKFFRGRGLNDFAGQPAGDFFTLPGVKQNKSACFQPPTPHEQQVLIHLEVCLVRPDEVARFDQLLVEHHYLKSAQLVGEHLRYVATYRGQWLALSAWNAPALHLKARDAFIGWSQEQRRIRLPLLVNNSRLLVLPGGQCPNLISRFMKLMLARLSDDWQAHWQHPLALAETFVDPHLYQGTAYKASGWTRLGHTAGWKRSAEDFYQKHDRPKQIWVRELMPKTCQKLRAPQLPSDWQSVEQNARPHCAAKAKEVRSLVEHLRAEVPEFRVKEALAYPLAGFLALIALAMFSGVRRGPQDLAEFAATLSQGLLRALGFRTDRRTGRLRCPGQSTFKRMLPRIDAAALERALLLWQEQILGPAQDKLVIVDGKTLRHAHVELVSAVNGNGRWLGTLPVQEGSNEIPAARQLLAQVPVANKTTLADAIHTQVESAQQILFEGGGDYALTVKANQKELVQTLETLLTPGKFSPSAHDADPRAESRAQSQSAGDSRAGLPGSDPRASGLSRCAAHCALAAAGATARPDEHRDGVSDQQPDVGATGRARLAATQTPLLGH
jgi:predicted transposase YbfD/YdcC